MGQAKSLSVVMESGGTDRRNGVNPPRGGRAAFSARTRQLTPPATETATRLAGQDAPQVRRWNE